MLNLILTGCLLIFSLNLFALEESMEQNMSPNIATPKKTSTEIASLIPEALRLEIQQMHTANPNIDLDMWLAICERMSALNFVLKLIIEEDQQRKEKDKQYILANSFTSFMYIMIAVGEHALAKNQQEVDFVPIIELIRLLIAHDLVTDHSSFDQMLSTLNKLKIEQREGDLIITLYTRSGDTIEESFKDGIPSPRFVISSVIFQNKAQFIFSELLLEKNAHVLAEFKVDSQKNFLTGGLVLMDKKKENILDFIEASQSNPEKNSNKHPLIKPMLIQGKGFAGHGYIKGLKLPSPSAQLETIYLLPGRAGTPAFVRAKSLFVRPFVAL